MLNPPPETSRKLEIHRAAEAIDPRLSALSMKPKPAPSDAEMRIMSTTPRDFRTRANKSTPSRGRSLQTSSTSGSAP
jgi:hypothetical protein